MLISIYEDFQTSPSCLEMIPPKKTAGQAVQRNVSAGQARFNAGP